MRDESRITDMTHWTKSLIVSADGAEEFVYLMSKALFHYGGVIGKGMYQHVQGSSMPNHIEATDCTKRPTLGGETSTDRDFSTGQFNSALPKESTYSTQETSNQHGSPENDPFPQDTPVIRTFRPQASSRHLPSTDRAHDEYDAHLRETIDGMRLQLDDQDSVLDFSDIAGLEEVKLALEEFACFFLHFPHLTRNLRQRSTTGILLFGPQGTGKTLIVRSFAKRYGLALYDVRASAIMSKFVGESEKFIRALFREIRAHAPAIILLDECDGLLCDPTADAMQSHHYRLLQNELKNQWSDLIQSRDEVIVIGATNKPHDIDMDGFGRRLSLKLHVDLPNSEGCQAILREALNRLHHNLDSDDFPVLGFLCHEKGLSGYDIDVLVEALLRRAIRNITIASYFIRIPWEDGHIYVPCEEEEPGATPGPWTNISPDEREEISYRPFVFSDVELAISKAKATVDSSMRQKHATFGAQYSTI